MEKLILFMKPSTLTTTTGIHLLVYVPVAAMCIIAGWVIHTLIYVHCSTGGHIPWGNGPEVTGYTLGRYTIGHYNGSKWEP